MDPLQRQDVQFEPTYSSSVPIRDVVLRICRTQWTIGRCGERGSGISMQIEWNDDDEEDDDDDCKLYLIFWNNMHILNDVDFLNICIFLTVESFRKISVPRYSKAWSNTLFLMLLQFCSFQVFYWVELSAHCHQVLNLEFYFFSYNDEEDKNEIRAKMKQNYLV